jgi:hypothetical protein
VEEWISVDSVQSIPCSDLNIIDQLWKDYSKGQFGFSVQVQIWQTLGGHSKSNQTVWNAFGQQIGWRTEILWLDLGWSMDPINRLRELISSWGEYNLNNLFRNPFMIIRLILLPFYLCFKLFKLLLFIFFSLPLLIKPKIKRGYFPTTIFPGHGIIVGRGARVNNNVTTNIEDNLTKLRRQLSEERAEKLRIKQQYRLSQAQSNEWGSRVELALQRDNPDLAEEARAHQENYNIVAENLKIRLDLITDKLAPRERKLIACVQEKDFIRYAGLRNWELVVLSDRLKQCRIE